MESTSNHVIRIAAALIDDGENRLLLVRKRGTRWFMQAGGKIEDAESARSTLERELAEEIGLPPTGHTAHYLGQFSAPAANEPDTLVVAEVFHVRTRRAPTLRAEIEEAIWVTRAEAAALPLAPLTRDHILALAGTV